LDAFTKVSRSVLVLAAAGRFGPPHPLREVSIRNPIVLGKPAATICVYRAWS